jgi:hypothetical protein
MKTIKLLSLLIILSLSSCKKNRVCVCTSEFNNETKEYDYGKMSWGKAYEQCKGGNTASSNSSQFSDWYCKLK